MADTGFSRPTLADLISRIEADFNTRLPGADSRLRRSVLSVLARVIAAAVHGLYGYLDFIIRQVFVDQAEVEFMERHAAIHGITRKAATKATGTVTFTGTNGTAINIGTVLQRSDGVEFVTKTAATISSGTATAIVEAVESGDTGNTTNGSPLTFVSPISGVNAQAASGELTGGADAESDDDLRARLLAKLQSPPHGGADFDYKAWALEVAGVTRAWVYPRELGPGSVVLRFMMDDTYEDGIPLAGDVLSVQEHVEALRPVTAELFVKAPVAQALNFSIRLKDADGDVETDPSIRDAVEAELKDLILREAEPKADGSINVKPTGTILFSHIRQAISNAAGEYDHEITAPAADVTPSATGKIFTMGTITWLS